jgi:LuxR family maltose regulon positive regulatory protein
MADEAINIHILRTKLQRPPVASDVLPRARLWDRLNEGRQRTLTLISAPAGYGKSTLASRWVATCDSPSGWVSLDERDSDLRTFLSYFLAAIRSLFPKAELRTEALLGAAHLPSTDEVARYLLNDLHQVTVPFILVLDDYHHIRPGAPVHDLVKELLAHPPQTMHLVLLTRRDPALPIARMRGLGRMTEIRASDLRFNSAETAAFLSNMLKVPVDDATVALLEKKTEGWVTGLRLAGLYLRDQVDLKQRAQELSGSSQHIAEYLVEEVLAKQNPNIAAFLVETSILDRFCAPLCQALHSKGIEKRNEEQDVDAERFIDWLVEANIFVIPLDDKGYWFRYHHLFREFLKALLRKRANPDTIPRLHMLASNWFADNGLTDEAIEHALAAGDTEAAVRLMLEHHYDLMNTSQFIRLHRWLKLLPKDAVAETPLLVSARAFIGIELGQASEVYICTDQADRMLSRLSPESGEYVILKSEMQVLKGFIDMAWGRPDRSLTHVKEALVSLPADALLIRSLGVFTYAVCLQMEGNPRQAAKVISEALLDRAWPVNIRARLHFSLSITHYMNANLAGAMSASRECLRIVQDLPFTHTKTFACYLLGAAYYWRNEITEAETHLLSVLDDCHASNPSYVANAGFVLACIYLARNLTGQAGQVLKRIVLHFQELGHLRAQAMTQAFQVEFALRQGHIKKALQLGKNIDFDMRPPIWFYYVPQLTPIKLLLAEGTDKSLKEAHTRLAELDEQMHRINRKSVRIDVLALLATVCNAQGEETSALENLQAALDLAEPGGWIRNFVDLGAPMLDLLERLNQAQPGTAFTQQALDACRAGALGKPSSDRDAEKTLRLSGQVLGQDVSTSETAPAPDMTLQPLKEPLTNRELDILALLALRLQNKEIAEKLFISPATVKTHLQNIYQKLSAKSRRQAVENAEALGILSRH